ncbi:hypothetical protein RJ640_006734 [Escallonia rubra]|uniref:Retrotransposon gag domain-containing protein n=1 Tax=Escallonia rubra TaxID=112253 RepID=A0AA88UKZ7_9ASTE|nr:hypothetical protein RJ640_006734 [Escallonia rubra]
MEALCLDIGNPAVNDLPTWTKLKRMISAIDGSLLPVVENVLYMAGQRDESTVGQGTQETDPNLREIIGLVGRIANALESSQNNQQHSQVGESSQVSEDAGFWWKTIDAKWTAGNVIRTWDLFITEFNNKYIPASVRRDRELAFLQLEQKNKTVQEYEKEFTALARHASYLVEGGDRKARKFETGLNPDIQEAIAPLNISDYHEIVDRALNIERTLKFTRAKRAHMSLSRPPVPQWQAGRFPSTSGDRKFLRTDMRSMAYTPRPQTQGFMPRPFITGPRPQPRPGVRPTQYIPPQQQPVQAVSRYCTFCGMTGHTEEPHSNRPSLHQTLRSRILLCWCANNPTAPLFSRQSLPTHSIRPAIKERCVPIFIDMAKDAETSKPKHLDPTSKYYLSSQANSTGSSSGPL